VNNAFLVRTSHHLALQFNDKSPLEMMHANKAFSLMHHSNSNILASFAKEERVAIRKIIITMVVDTDNENHHTLMQKFTLIRVSGSMNFNENPEHQQSLLSMILHSMDVSNVARPWAICRKYV
jgi:hypothetical protein